MAGHGLRVVVRLGPIAGGILTLRKLVSQGPGRRLVDVVLHASRPCAYRSCGRKMGTSWAFPGQSLIMASSSTPQKMKNAVAGHEEN